MAKEIATGGTEDNGNYSPKSERANTLKNPNGNNPHGLPNFNACRTNLFNCKTLLNVNIYT